MSIRLCSALLLVLILLPSAVQAQSIKHKVTPRVIDREVQQRDIFTEDIVIENFAGHKVTIFPTVNEVAIDEGGDITDFTQASIADNRTTVTSWLEISRAGIDLLAGASTTIPLTIHIHPQAEPGIYHAFIGFGTGRNRDIATDQVEKGIAPGVVVTLGVEQNRQQALKLSSFMVDRFVTDAGEDAVQYTLSNPGTDVVVPSGEIIISNNRGEEVGTVVINPTNEVLVPGESREYVTHLSTEGLLGKYKAFLSVDYGGTQLASVYDTAFFYVFPWQRIALFFGILSIIV
ncbi:MAG: hypothetical protein AAFO91_07155, partial [Bacteroidota bacterium]